MRAQRHESLPNCGDTDQLLRAATELESFGSPAKW